MTRTGSFSVCVTLALGGIVTVAACQVDAAVAPREAVPRLGTQRATSARGAPVVTITDLGTLPGHISGLAMGCNVAGQVVGWSESVFEQRAVLWQDGTITDLGTFGGPRSRAFDVSPSGQVVGVSESAEEWPNLSENHAFVWENGSMTDLGLGWAFSISSSGRIVGDGEGQTSLWHKKTIIDLGNIEARDVNTSGQVVGQGRTTSGALHAFMWQDGILSDLGTLGGSFSSASAINPSGQVVGGSETSDGAYHAFLWQRGTMTDLGTLGGHSSHAEDISASGDIVGWSWTAIGELHAFLLRGGEMSDLGTLPGHAQSAATCVTPSGRTIAGYSNDGQLGPNRPTLWTIR